MGGATLGGRPLNLLLDWPSSAPAPRPALEALVVCGDLGATPLQSGNFGQVSAWGPEPGLKSLASPPPASNVTTINGLGLARQAGRDGGRQPSAGEGEET